MPEPLPNYYILFTEVAQLGRVGLAAFPSQHWALPRCGRMAARLLGVRTPPYRPRDPPKNYNAWGVFLFALLGFTLHVHNF